MNRRRLARLIFRPSLDIGTLLVLATVSLIDRHVNSIASLISIPVLVALYIAPWSWAMRNDVLDDE